MDVFRLYTDVYTVFGIVVYCLGRFCKWMEIKIFAVMLPKFRLKMWVLFNCCWVWNSASHPHSRVSGAWDSGARQVVSELEVWKPWVSKGSGFRVQD